MQDLLSSVSPTRTGNLPAHTPRSALPTATPATVADPPRELLRLPPGHLLHGVVLGQNGRGETLVRANEGLLRLILPQSYPKGSELTLEIRSSGTRLQVLVLNAHLPSGQGVRAAAAPAPQGGPPPAPSSIASQSTANSILSVGQSLQAILQSSPPHATAGKGTPLPGFHTPGASLPNAGDRLSLRVLGIGIPSTVLQGDSYATSGQRPASQAHLSPSWPYGVPAGAATPGSGTSLQAGHALALQLQSQRHLAATALGSTLASLLKPLGSQGTSTTAFQHPVAGTGQPTTPLSGLPNGTVTPGSGTLAGHSLLTSSGVPRTFTAQVLTANAQGQHLLHSPLGTLSLDLKGALPLGTSLTLQLLEASANVGRSPGAFALSSAGASFPNSWQTTSWLGKSWPALTKLSQLAASSHDTALPPNYDPAVNIPKTGPTLTSGLLFFLSALKGPAMAAWLSPHSSGLSKGGRTDLLERLNGEMARAARTPEVVGEWRLFPLPILHEGTLHGLRLFIRRDDGQSGHHKKPGGDRTTRFLVEMTLARYGDLQLDGLVQSKRFDLILRCQCPLQSHQRKAITEIFHNTAGAAGLGGRISFRVGSFPSPLASPAKKSESLSA
ncbi:MAG: hypothetical protein AAF530_05035 [Pseudomonadota bacterium]